MIHWVLYLRKDYELNTKMSNENYNKMLKLKGENFTSDIQLLSRIFHIVHEIINKIYFLKLTSPRNWPLREENNHIISSSR